MTIELDRFPDIPEAAWDRVRWPNFARHELACRHTGLCRMDPAFLDWLQRLRGWCGFPFVITSGYRHPTHPIEAAKGRPGWHASGQAVDIRCAGEAAHKLLRHAMDNRVGGIGVSQKGDWGSRYLHLDWGPNRIWSY